MFHYVLLLLQERYGTVYPVVLLAVVFPPIEQHGESNQNPAEAELKVSQDVDGEDEGKRLAELNPHLGDICQRGLRFSIQLFWGQRWAYGGAHRAAWRRDGSYRIGAWSPGTLHSVTHFPTGKTFLTFDISHTAAYEVAIDSSLQSRGLLLQDYGSKFKEFYHRHAGIIDQGISMKNNQQVDY